jgi:glycerol-3-phosphate dehydrogenase (NAD(P)+)
MEHSGPIGVVGAGSWGTTLAQLLAAKGQRVDLWVYEDELCEIIRKTRENSYYLPGFNLDQNISPHTDLRQVVENHSLLVMVVPSHVYRNVATQMLPFVKSGTIVVSATKGIENETLLTMSGIWSNLVNSEGLIRVLCLSGPSFAREVVQKIPTAITVAGENLEVAKMIQQVFSTATFRVFKCF